eukprot:865824-Heterocapsa_arctica.AAC.1
MGAIWGHFPLVQAAAQAGHGGSRRMDGINVLEYDSAHAKLRHEEVFVQCEVLAEHWNGYDQSSHGGRGESKRRSGQVPGEYEEEAMERTKRPRGEGVFIEGLDDTKESMGGTRIRGVPGGRTGRRFKENIEQTGWKKGWRGYEQQEKLRYKPQHKCSGQPKQNNLKWTGLRESNRELYGRDLMSRGFTNYEPHSTQAV